MIKKKNDGFGIVDKNILFNTELSRDARLIYTILAAYADDKRSCFPSIHTLMKVLGMSKSTFYKHMTQLEKKGIVEKKIRKKGNLLNGIIYVLHDFR